MSNRTVVSNTLGSIAGEPGNLSSQTVENTGVYYFEARKEGRKWFLHGIKFPITLAHAMKLVHRAGLKKLGSLVGKNKHDHGSSLSTQTNAVHAPIMLGERKQVGVGEGENEQEKRKDLRVENWGQAWRARGS